MQFKAATPYHTVFMHFANISRVVPSDEKYAEQLLRWIDTKVMPAGSMDRYQTFLHAQNTASYGSPAIDWTDPRIREFTEAEYVANDLYMRSCAESTYLHFFDTVRIRLRRRVDQDRVPLSHDFFVAGVHQV